MIIRDGPHTDFTAHRTVLVLFSTQEYECLAEVCRGDAPAFRGVEGTEHLRNSIFLGPRHCAFSDTIRIHVREHIRALTFSCWL